jgi:hypothetical protein
MNSSAKSFTQRSRLFGGKYANGVKLHFRSVVWIEVVLASIIALLAIVSVLWRDWVERVFGIDPDHHSGFTEWELVVALSLAATLVATLAGRDWYRAALAASVEREGAHADSLTTD